METDVAEYLAGVLVVAGELGTTVVVMPGMDGVDALAAGLLLEKLHQFLGDAVHATYGRNHPNLVSHTDLAILADIALEGAVFLGDVEGLIDWIVCIFQRAGEVGLEVVLVDPLALFQVFLGMTDRVSILDDVRSFRCVLDEHLVTSRCVLQECNGLAVHLDGLALLHRAQANHYRVGRVDFDKA